MKRNTFLKWVLVVLVVFSGIGSLSSQILTFEFSALAGNETTATSNSNNANLTSSTISRGAGLTASANAQRFNATNWALTSIDNAVSGNNYMEFTITPNSGFQFTVSSIVIQLQRSSTGPSAIALRNSLDSYTSNLNQIYSITDNTSTQTITFTFTQAESTSAVTYRMYMFAEAVGGSGGPGDGTGNDIVVNGTVTSTGGTPIVSTPVFSPLSGTYYTAQNITVTSETSGASIYYTTDGSEPDNTKTLYSTPFSVSTTTTVKAIAYKDGMTTSSVSSAVYTFPVINDVANIATLRLGATDGTVYRLTGQAILALKTASRNAKYIQDATAGVLIDDPNGKITTIYNAGDGITNITGTLGIYSNMLQFTPVIDPGTATSTGNTVTPVSIELANLANYPGQLVKVSGVSITGTGNFAASTSYNLNGSTSTVLRTAYTDLPWIGSAIPSAQQDISGVVLISSAVAQLVPRTISDFVNSVTVTPTIQVTEVSVPAMSAVIGNNDIETITVSGQNLTENVSLNLSGTDAALFSLSASSITPVSGSITDVSVNITYTPVAPGSHTATLTLSSAGATDVVKTLTASATWPPIDTPVATDATGLSSAGFTANWNAVSGATEYKVNVYTKTTGLVSATDLFISEYVEGTSNNKYIEIFNGTGSSVDLSNYKLQLYANGSATTTSDITLSGNLENGMAVVYKNSSAALTLPNGVIATSSSAANFNGDDALALYKISTSSYVDIFGKIGEDPGVNWAGDGGITTLDKTLVRKSSVTGGVTSNPSTGFPTLATEWEMYNTDDASHLGSHTMSGSGTTTTPISGSPFTVTGETSKSLTGLTSGTTYYYTVQALNTNVQSSLSNEISAVTSFGTGLDNNKILSIAVKDGKIIMQAVSGQTIEVYNALGQRLLSHQTTDGLNILNPQVKGLVIVKSDNQIIKLIL